MTTMDFEYSPHRSAGGTFHLLSPTHPQYSIDAFPAIKQLRRSLSRSPSKPSRFQLYTTTKSPNKKVTSPLSPSGLSRAFSATAATDSIKNKFHLRRNAPIHANANARKTSPNCSLRRALSDGNSQGNTTTVRPSSRSDEEEDRENAFATDDMEMATDMRFELDSEPIKFDLLKAHADKPNSLSAVMREHMSPVKSSPLKRSDGVMNLDQVSVGSPLAKRRSLHIGNDFDIFDQGFDGHNDCEDGYQPFMASPARQRSPQKRAFNLRKSTLQHRATTGSRPRLFHDASDSASSPAVPRTRSRMSLDGALPLRGLEPLPFLPAPEQRPTSRSAPKPHPLSKTLSPSSSASSLGEDTTAPPTTVLKLNPKPFLGFSKSLPVGALRPKTHNESTQDSNESFETPEAYKMAKPLPAAFMSTGLISKRNRNVDLPSTSFGSSLNMPDTPSKKTAMPHIAGTPAPTPGFAKYSRPQHEFGSPTTPWSPHAVKASPESFGKGVSIFGSRAGGNRRASFLSINDTDNENDNETDDDYSKSPSGSAHLDVQSGNDDMPPTPTKASTGSATVRPVSRGKGNSLRSSLFGRRSSLAPDTFVAPNADDCWKEPQLADSKFLSINTSSSSERNIKSDDQVARPTTPTFSITPCGSPSHNSSFSSQMNLRQTQTRPCPTPLTLRSRGFPLSFTPTTANAEADGPTAVYGSPVDLPQTPMESFTPPDPSGLTISGEHRGPVMFNLSTNSNSFPPATPTGPRDHGNSFGISHVAGGSLSGFFGNDVDTTITSRFSIVQPIGTGEFSQVYRVEKPIAGSPAAQQATRKVGNVWAVKKAKKPYLGQRDRERKLREVEILQALRGNEHIIDLSDTWECKGHLYIQTEFCENGNLKDFLTQTGFKGRLDDFRIWKILLELCQGVKSIHDAGFIHLDLKPANVLLDWEGVLKIADFGMASSWPAPKGLDGEGDREYIGPEVLAGRFDKPADIFSLGMIMLEIAGNIVLPDNGLSWQRLRSGDLSDLPSLTFSSESSLPRDASGDPVNTSDDTFQFGDDLDFIPISGTPRRDDLLSPPNFMVDNSDSEALDKVVQWLINPFPEERPSIDHILDCGGVQWVAARRRAGATVYEGNWGPAVDVRDSTQGDVEMMDI